MLVQIIRRWLLGSSARSHVLLGYQVSRSAPLDAEEAFVGVSFVVGAADGFVVLWTYSGTSFEGEGGEAALNWHNKDVLAAIVFAHVTLGLVQLVITAADVAWLLTVQCVAIDIAELRLRTVLK